MKTIILDIETSALNAPSGIILCVCAKEYGKKKLTTWRADAYRNWKTHKSDNSFLVKDVINYIKEFDIAVAYNGCWFDSLFIDSQALKYGLKPVMRDMKIVDPYRLAKRFLKLNRNSLASVIDFLSVPDSKSPISFECWLRASHDSSTKDMDYIVKHCERDVLALESVYDKVKVFVKTIDNNGSAK